MLNNYIFGIVAAILVVIGGLFLLGRDGTEEVASPLTTPTANETASGSLLIDPSASTTEKTGAPELGDKATSTTAEINNLLESETGSVTEKTNDTGIVTYTDSGFSPKTIEIEQGDTVTFINNSSRNMWVASSRHPTHNDYPEESDKDCLGSSFDACVGIPTGENWSFTFNRIGEWGYHDHLSASRTGTIIVQ